MLTCSAHPKAIITCCKAFIWSFPFYATNCIHPYVIYLDRNKLNRSIVSAMETNQITIPPLLLTNRMRTGYQLYQMENREIRRALILFNLHTLRYAIMAAEIE